MKTIKELKEYRNTLLDKAESFVKAAEEETRNLTETENEEFRTIETEITQLDEKINELENRQFDGEKMDKEEKRTMNINETEVRGLEQYLRRQDGEEKRELNVTADGGAVIPETIADTIITKMEETSPVFARARKFASVAGALKIAKENADTDAGFVGEGQNVLEGKIGFEEVKLTQKRVGAAISLSNQLINDAAVNIVDYSVGLLARRTGKAVEKSILTGAGTDEFRGIVADEEIESVELGEVVTIDSLLELYNAVHPEYLDSASYIMSRKFFNQIAKLKDGNGHYYMQNGVVNGSLTYTLFGAEVVVTDALTDETPVLFGSIEQSYAVMVKKGLSLQHVTGDTTQALRGSQLLVLDGYMDGTVYNPSAIAKGTVAAEG